MHESLRNVKLGKKPAVHDVRTLKLEKYIKALPPPPDNFGWQGTVPNFPMMLNDTLGDCTIAAAGHLQEVWSANVGSLFCPTDSQVLAAYEAVSGYSPNKPGSDNGAVIMNVLTYWKNTGIAGKKIYAYMSINPKNHTEIKQAIQLFGAVYVGIGLPITAQDPIVGTNGNLCWSMPQGGATGNGAPWSWGGHCVIYPGFGIDTKGNHGYLAVSWGTFYDVTPGFQELYSDEIYAIVSPEWLNAQGKSPTGLDINALNDDLAQL